ncbi:DNA primase [Elysia marginata]|uniref:DNA primase n=1 Tax=Elysia marginata TaxID=1093978 RepID=A0AAV4FQ30_9GAST|nr:DNA primase [Elysia marginata]
MVSPSKQIWKDFSSGKGGNAISFLIEHERVSYVEAIKYLAKKYGIEVEERELTEKEKQDSKISQSLLVINGFAQEFFENTLWNSQEGKSLALTYFKERGFSDEIMKQFNLGYSTKSRDAFTKEAIKKQFKVDLLEKTGLTVINQGRQFDRFSGRIIFPIYSLGGQVLGFGGRILSNNKKTAKYINSPESEVYKKSEILYGIFQAKQELSKKDNCILVEGYTDVIQFHQAGICNTVASSGTALTPGQVRLIQRFTKNITLVYDNDRAGIEASFRGVDTILENGLNVEICLLPEGEDPDSFAKNNSADEVNNYIKKNSKDFITSKAELYKNEIDDPIKKSEIINGIVESISKISDLVTQEIYVKECASIMNISEKTLFSSLSTKAHRQRLQKFRKERTQPSPLSVISEGTPTCKISFQDVLERTIIKVLLLYGHLEVFFDDYNLDMDRNGKPLVSKIKVKKKVFEKIFLDLQEDEITFSNSIFKAIFEIIMTVFQNSEKLNIENLISKLSPEQAQHVSGILMESEKYKLAMWESKNVFVKSEEKGIAQLIQDTIIDFRHLMIEKIIDQIESDIAEKNSGEEPDKKEEVLEYIKLNNLLLTIFNRRIIKKS